MRIMRTCQKQADGYTQQEFLGWSELISVIHLLPHVEVVVRSSVEFERNAPDPMEHEVRTKHVGNIGEDP